MGRDYKKIRAWQLSDELAYYIDFSGRIGYINSGDFECLSDSHLRTSKTLRALISFIEKSKDNSPKSNVHSLTSKVHSPKSKV